ncbi:conserved hypothetical protein [Magnetococcus marinus MC-1]|uniref:Glycosyl transferase, family 11 n=1 Tax=Magnetococcus marinus (strain ATCC BAA-1437 / JCM 17883 / MC-1) TaxID=156889 RepID=A0LDP6_MAGMM|nr:hypothetical protein [Magnetococcus marinus]ABK46089.1 conserved hypothetical protein [Magnetococcus marinus MC-1]
MWFKRIVSSNYTGLCNRLEGLVLCFAYQEQFGHTVCVDWPELDLLHIKGAKRWHYNPIDKWMGVKLRDPSPAAFHQLGKQRVLIQRGTVGGDAEILDRLFMPTMGRIGLAAAGRAQLRALFEQAKEALVVGVHIRRGDFQAGDPSRYDIHAARHPQVPLWWYQYAMDQVQKRYGHVVFYLSHNNLSATEEHQLRTQFNLLPSLASGRFNPGGGHLSATNPVLDLFALACSPVVITTPMSTFSHYGANVLGPASVALLPLPVMEQHNPGLSMSQLYGQRSPAWFSCLHENKALQPVPRIEALPERTEKNFLSWLDNTAP